MGYSKHTSSAARFTHLAGQLVTDEAGGPLVNDTIDKETGAILRFRNGLLDGGALPAVECEDFHMEFYRKGQLHRDGGPAVVADGGKVKEHWNDGVRQS
jgi:hypothetical protein